MNDLFSRMFRPARKQSIFRTERSGASGVARVFGGLVVCLVVTALLSSDRLVTMAERQEFGPSRDRWLAAAEAVDGVASALRLDRPAAAADAALGRDGDGSTDVVLGELAAASIPAVSTPPERVIVAPTTTAELPAEPVAATSTAPTTTTTIPTTTTSTTAPPPSTLGVVDLNQPLRIWTGGDSLGEYVGSELLYRVADTDFTTVELDFEISTGLARPDYFDWPARFSEVMQRDDRPHVAVFMVGGNDDQDLLVDGERAVVGTPEWQEAYRSRVATMMDIAAYPEVQMLWINLPPMRDGRRAEISEQINEAIRVEAERRPWVDVIDIVGMFTGANGGYDQFIDDPDGESTRRARAPDGVHITRAGSNWVAEVVWDTITPRWEFDRLTPRTTAPPTTPANDGAVAPGDQPDPVPPPDSGGTDADGSDGG